MKKHTPRLALRRQTVRSLSDASRAVGGKPVVKTSVLPYVCETDFCESKYCDPPVTWYGCPID
jgi:hypothetical protein